MRDGVSLLCIRILPRLVFCRLYCRLVHVCCLLCKPFRCFIVLTVLRGYCCDFCWFLFAVSVLAALWEVLQRSWIVVTHHTASCECRRQFLALLKLDVAAIAGSEVIRCVHVLQIDHNTSLLGHRCCDCEW